MSQCEAASAADLAELWRQRFGQPPPIIAEPELMLRILQTVSPRPAPQPRSWVEAD